MGSYILNNMNLTGTFNLNYCTVFEVIYTKHSDLPMLLETDSPSIQEIERIASKIQTVF